MKQTVPCPQSGAAVQMTAWERNLMWQPVLVVSLQEIESQVLMKVLAARWNLKLQEQLMLLLSFPQSHPSQVVAAAVVVVV
jgi:hypothetical protein